MIRFFNFSLETWSSDLSQLVVNFTAQFFAISASRIYVDSVTQGSVIFSMSIIGYSLGTADQLNASSLVMPSSLGLAAVTDFVILVGHTTPVTFNSTTTVATASSSQEFSKISLGFIVTTGGFLIVIFAFIFAKKWRLKQQLDHLNSIQTQSDDTTVPLYTNPLYGSVEDSVSGQLSMGASINHMVTNILYDIPTDDQLSMGESINHHMVTNILYDISTDDQLSMGASINHMVKNILYDIPTDHGQHKSDTLNRLVTTETNVYFVPVALPGLVGENEYCPPEGGGAKDHGVPFRSRRLTIISGRSDNTNDIIVSNDYVDYV